MRTLLTALLLSIALVTTPACRHLPPNLTPAATKAWYGTQAIKTADVVMEIANDAHNTVPPLLSAADALKVVNWHQSALSIIHEGATGWDHLVTSSLNELMRDLPPSARDVLAPYAALIKNILNEVQQ